MPTLSDFLDYFLHKGKSGIAADVASSEQIDQATNQITIQLMPPIIQDLGIKLDSACIKKLECK